MTISTDRTGTGAQAEGRSDLHAVPAGGTFRESLPAAIIELALKEDIGTGDITSQSVVPQQSMISGHFVYKQRAVVAGLHIIDRIFEVIDPSVEIVHLLKDGDLVEQPPRQAVYIRGNARSILIGERTALNFIQRLSGIATLAREFAELSSPFGIKVLDTRKTTPGLRAMEKYAVSVGGGTNHRFGLFDAILIKDNHITVAGGLTAAISKARNANPGIPVEVEAATEEEVREAAGAGADVILLDNMDPTMIRKCIEIIAGRAQVEVSGGVNRANIRNYLMHGVDRISVGALTHSAKNIDISLEVE